MGIFHVLQFMNVWQQGLLLMALLLVVWSGLKAPRVDRCVFLGGLCFP